VAILEDRELSVAGGSTPKTRELIREVVEGGPEVVDSIARDQSEAWRQSERLRKVEPDDDMPGLRVTLGREFARVCLDGDSDLLLENFQMLPGATYLQPRTAEWMGHAG